MERQLDLQIAKLKKRIVKMCSLIDDQIDAAFRAVEQEDEELAKQVIEMDKKVDKYDLKIEKACQKIFALNQPVAMDLRLIMSAMSMDTNLERIGDNAVNICEQFLQMKSKPEFFEQTKFNEMAAVVRLMIKNSIDAYITNSSELAKDVIAADDKLDDLDRENRDILIQIMKQDCENVEPGVTMLSISRMMERLGDLTTNIAEDVYFISEAQIIKHKYEKYLFLSDDDDDEIE